MGERCVIDIKQWMNLSFITHKIRFLFYHYYDLMHHGVDTTSPLEGTFSDKKQRKVVQPKCSIDESTSRLCKDNAV